jgi:uncharacterized membrane protein
MRELQSFEVIMAMRSAMLASVVAGTLAIAPAGAQTPTVQADDPSLSYSALKATTYKIGTSLANFGILSYAAGDFSGGTVLAIANTAASWVMYTTNDYLWDTFSPAPSKTRADQSFDTSAEFWRNTGKFLTYKPPVFLFKLASIYVYTGSATTALLFGPASSLTNTVVFYINITAWDLYDWYAAVPKTAVAAKF